MDMDTDMTELVDEVTRVQVLLEDAGINEYDVNQIYELLETHYEDANRVNFVAATLIDHHLLVLTTHSDSSNDGNDTSHVSMDNTSNDPASVSHASACGVRSENVKVVYAPKIQEAESEAPRAIENITLDVSNGEAVPLVSIRAEPPEVAARDKPADLPGGHDQHSMTEYQFGRPVVEMNGHDPNNNDPNNNYFPDITYNPNSDNNGCVSATPATTNAEQFSGIDDILCREARSIREIVPQVSFEYVFQLLKSRQNRKNRIQFVTHKLLNEVMSEHDSDVELTNGTSHSPSKRPKFPDIVRLGDSSDVIVISDEEPPRPPKLAKILPSSLSTLTTVSKPTKENPYCFPSFKASTSAAVAMGTGNEPGENGGYDTVPIIAGVLKIDNEGKKASDAERLAVIYEESDADVISKYSFLNGPSKFLPHSHSETFPAIVNATEQPNVANSSLDSVDYPMWDYKRYHQLSKKVSTETKTTSADGSIVTVTEKEEKMEEFEKPVKKSTSYTSLIGTVSNLGQPIKIPVVPSYSKYRTTDNNGRDTSVLGLFELRAMFGVRDNEAAHLRNSASATVTSATVTSASPQSATVTSAPATSASSSNLPSAVTNLNSAPVKNKSSYSSERILVPENIPSTTATNATILQHQSFPEAIASTSTGLSVKPATKPKPLLQVNTGENYVPWRRNKVAPKTDSIAVQPPLDNIHFPPHTNVLVVKDSPDILDRIDLAETPPLDLRDTSVSNQKPPITAPPAAPVVRPPHPYLGKIREMFPHVDVAYLERRCYELPANAPLNALAILLLDETDLPVQPPEIERPPTEQERNEGFRTFSEILPDADPEFLQSTYERIGNDEDAIKNFVADALENRNYPTAVDYEKRQKEIKLRQEYTNEFNIERFLQAFPDPFAHFQQNSGVKEPVEVQIAKRYYLMDRFRSVKCSDIDSATKKHNFNLYQVCKDLTQIVGSKQNLRGTRRTEGECKQYKTNTNVAFLQEIAFVDNQTKINNYLEEKEEWKRTAIQEATAKGEFLTCNCCYADDVLFLNMGSCNDGHLFCKDCIRKGAEVQIGEGKTKLPCLMDCGEQISLGTLEAVLEPSVYTRMAQRQQMEEVMAAGVEGLEVCPFCDFGLIPLPEDKVFSCLNPSCMKQSCRSCKGLSHIPLRCNEVEQPAEIKARTYIEDKMTEALLRTCWKCSKKFIKSDGCNKMTCTCGARMCYLCQKPVNDYTHFNGQGGDAIEKCPLYSNNDLIHVNAVAAEAVRAKEEMAAQNPTLQLKHDPTLILPEARPAPARLHPQVLVNMYGAVDHRGHPVRPALPVRPGRPAHPIRPVQGFPARGVPFPPVPVARPPVPVARPPVPPARLRRGQQPRAVRQPLVPPRPGRPI